MEQVIIGPDIESYRFVPYCIAQAKGIIRSDLVFHHINYVCAARSLNLRSMMFDKIFYAHTLIRYVHSCCLPILQIAYKMCAKIHLLCTDEDSMR